MMLVQGVDTVNVDNVFRPPCQVGVYLCTGVICPRVNASLDCAHNLDEMYPLARITSTTIAYFACVVCTYVHTYMVCMYVCVCVLGAQ